MKYLVMAALILGCTASSFALPADSASHAPKHAAFDPQRDAAKDIAAAVEEAAKTGRRVLLDVGGNWCKWCRMLDNFFETNADVANLLNRNFVVVKVNFSKENENKEVLSRYPKVQGYPHFFVLGSDGTLIHSQNTGELEKGQGYDPVKMKAFLTKWTE